MWRPVAASISVAHGRRPSREKGCSKFLDTPDFRHPSDLHQLGLDSFVVVVVVVVVFFLFYIFWYIGITLSICSSVRVTDHAHSVSPEPQNLSFLFLPNLV